MNLSVLPLPLNFKNSSFALKTIQDRWPIILAQTVDSLYRYRREYEANGVDMNKLKALTGTIGELRHQVSTNKPITKFAFDVANDLDLWNTQLGDQGVTLIELTDETKKESDSYPNWYSLPWLFMECYLYRRIAEAVYLNGLGPQFDPFVRKKLDGFYNSLPFVHELLRFMETSMELKHASELGQYCKLFFQVSLWANEFDLSLNLDENFTVERSEDLSSHVSKMLNRLVVNDTDLLWDLWHGRHQAHTPTTSLRTVIIVLDNSGPELVADLCFAEFILHHGLAHRIHFYPKMMPWFVSDVTMFDLDLLLGQILLSSSVPESMRDIFHRWSARWQTRMERGEFSLCPSSFWTLPCSYDELRTVDPVLYGHLTDQSVDVIFFKGDLNYRKICADRTWTPDNLEHKLTAFRPLQLGRSIETCTCGSSSIALGTPLDCRCSVSPYSSAPPLVVALRVAKADVAVGLTPGMLDRVLSEASDDWWIRGHYGMVQVVSPIYLGH